MGFIRSANKDYSGAVDAFKKAEKLASDNEDLLLDIANTYVDMDRLGSARQYLQKARRIDPQSCKGIIIEGNICVEQTRTEVSEEGVGVRDKLKFKCCRDIYRRAVCKRCGKWADVARLKIDYLDQFMPTAQEEKEFYFINPEMEGKICQ